MTPENVLLALRLAAALLLLAFLATLFWAIRRDMALTAEQVSARQQRHGQLVVISAEGGSPEVGALFPLLPVTTLGRAPVNTVPLPDSYASTHHALITLRSGRWWLEDRESRNGTTLNGQLLAAPTVVSAGDVIGIGRVMLKLELD